MTHALLVDDDTELRVLVADYLRRYGMQVTAVADGAGLRAELKTGSFDVLLLDLMLPDANGLDLCRWLRHAGSAKVSVSTLQGHAHVAIDDEGPGIPAAELEAVFQAFYRLESARGQANSGTGLGLHIARDLVQRYGGQLTLANRTTGGLRAELVLPLA